jgi:predicted AAA+ superfamily ATPase
VGLKGYARAREELFDERLDELLAPSLADVYFGRGHEVYRDPDRFFAATHFSDSMRRVLGEVTETLHGRGFRRVFPLFSLYGGGKTHLLVAILHAVRRPGALAAVDAELARLYAEARPRLVVLDGESDELCPNPEKPLNLAHYRVQTVWGSLAHQLGRYDALRSEDEKVYPPTAEALRRLLGEEPAVILVDEIAKYASRFTGSSDERLQGYGRGVIAFLESLARAVEGTRTALVVTLPLEVRAGEERYVEAYEREARMLREALGRVAAAYDVPLAPEDVVHVLKKRIFESVDAAAAAQLRSRYLELYSSEQEVFGKVAVNRASKLDEYAPFHPSYVEALYDVVTRHSNLQRTRDALRITRAVVRGVLRSGDDPDFVMPWHVLRYLDPQRVEGLLLGQAFSYFKPVVDKDLLGRAARLGPLVQAVAASVFVRTYVYGLATKPERAFPSREDVAFMVYERSLAELTGTKPVDVVNALELASRELLYMQERDGRYWFNPMPSIIEIVQDEARRASLVEARERLVRALKELAESPPPGASKKEAAPQLFSVVEVRDEPLPVDEPKYSLVIVPRVPSDSELRELVLSTAGGKARVYRNTVAVLYPRSEERLSRLLDLCRELAACDAVAGRIEELYAAEDMRELQRRKLNQYKRDRVAQLYNEIINAYDAIAFPTDDGLGKSAVSPRATSLARIAEMALESPEVGKAYISKLDFETLNHLLKHAGVDLSESSRELSVKEVLSYIFTNPRLPFIKRDLVLEALKEGVKLLRIGVQRGGEVYFARVYELGEIAAVPEGRPPGLLEDSDIVLPWRIAAEKLLDRLRPEVREQLDGRRLRVYYVLVVEGQELELQGIPREKAVEMLKAYPIVRKSEEVVLGVDVGVEPSYVEVKPGSRIEVKVSVVPIGKVEQPVELSVDAGEIEPREGAPPFTAVWRLEAPGDEGRYAYEVRAVSVPGKPVARQLTISVQRERVTVVWGFEVSDHLECENLAKLFPGVILEEGQAQLAAEGQEVQVSGRGLAPDVFVELVKEAMSLTGIRSARFYARLRLLKPLEPAEVDRLTAGLRNVRKLEAAVR